MLRADIESGILELGEGEADSVAGGAGARDDIIFHKPLAWMPETDNGLAPRHAKHVLQVLRLFPHVLLTQPVSNSCEM